MTSQAASQPQAAAKTSETVEVSVMERVLGAAFLGMGLGSFLYGLIVLISEAKFGAGFANALKFVGPVGPLSGKTTLGVIAFVLSWVGLHFGLKNRSVKLTTAFTISIVLLVLGVLMSFPPVFELFAQ